jgi:phosphatidylserine decarboxylase
MMDRQFLLSLFSLRVHPQAWTFLACSGLVTLALALTPWRPLFWLGIVLTLAIALFFRNPKRHTPAIANGLFSPADGTIVEISHEAPPAELDLQPTLAKTGSMPEGSLDQPAHPESTEVALVQNSAWQNEPAAQEDQSQAMAATGWTKIGIFLSPFDVHINRIPLSGTVRQRFYRPGLFAHVVAPGSRHNNERLSLVIQTPSNSSVVCTQIAGFMARRIVCYANERDQVIGGDVYGLICFGSRVDLYIPTDAIEQLLVCKGQRVRGGESILGLMR